MADKELVDIPRRLTGPLRDRRRMLAIGALVLGLGAAWLQGHDDRAEIQVSLLLTHADVQVGETVIEHQRLSEVIIRVPAGDRDGPSPWRKSLSYAPGQVPKVTAAQTISLPEDVDHLEVGCVFDLGAGNPLRTWTTVTVQRKRSDLQVVEVNGCGAPEGSVPAQ